MLAEISFLCAIPHIGEVVATTRGGKVMRAMNPKGVYTCKCGRTLEVYLRCVSVSCNLHGEMTRVKSKRVIQQDAEEAELLAIESGAYDMAYEAECEARAEEANK